MTHSTHDRDRNVIDLFAKRGSRDVEQHRFVRLSPEYDGISMLYSNTRSKNTLYTMKVLCWGLRANGDVVGLVPWLNKAVPCPSLANPVSGEWEGYYDPDTDDTGSGAPPIVDMGADEFQVLTCPWDLDGDDLVGTGDLILLLGSWGDPYGTTDLIELRNLVVVAKLVVECALRRRESRGLHYTLDFPEADARFLRDTLLQREP